MNAITRHISVKKPKLPKAPQISAPEWLEDYIVALGKVFYVLTVIASWIFFLLTPWVIIMWLLLRLMAVPAKPVHNGWLIFFGDIFLSIFWYTFAYVIYQKHEQTRRRKGRDL